MTTFMEDIARVYTDYPELVEAARKGHPFLGRYLDDARVDISNIVKAKSPDEAWMLILRRRAENDLYGRWLEGERP